MTEFEIGRYKKTCAEYTALLIDYCLSIKPGMTEIEIANGLLCTGLDRHIRFPALMVGSDERVSLYRHPAATDKIVKKYVLFATVVEREGICASVSRSVYFDTAPEELKTRQDEVNTIEASYPGS